MGTISSIFEGILQAQELAAQIRQTWMDTQTTALVDMLNVPTADLSIHSAAECIIALQRTRKLDV
jgi:hypothetical protein